MRRLRSIQALHREAGDGGIGVDCRSDPVSGGWRRGLPPIVRLGTDRYAYAKPAGNKEPEALAGLRDGCQKTGIPQGRVYYLRFLRGKGRTWSSAGPDADRPLAALLNKQRDPEDVCLGRGAPGVAPNEPSSSIHRRL